MDKRVLIFDDDKDILDICSLILQASGYVVFISTHCNTLFETIASASPSVIVMDNKMPGLCGVEAIPMLKSDPRTLSIPVILFSANTNVQQLSEEAGADFHLQKPFDIVEFETLLDSIIQSQETLKHEAVDKPID